MLTRDELLNKLTNIGTSQDEAERRTLLTEITEDLTSVYDSNETLTKANAKFEADNKKLQEHNMKLFLKISDQTKPVPKVEKQEKQENLKYENLFNDKGELK
jgi:hypothetical protein